MGAPPRNCICSEESAARRGIAPLDLPSRRGPFAGEASPARAFDSSSTASRKAPWPDQATAG
ncbi:MAG: hypothetical protein LBU32_16275 [Clostridiales bacterium]|nr:hypothetical protein [Clostridiales bacterium]